MAVLVAGVLAASSVAAHHSFSLDYHEDRSTTIEGSVEEFLYRNPHAIVKVRVGAGDGATAVWAAEWAGAGRLSRQNVMANTLQPGDVVRITGAPGRVPADNRIHLKQIVRPADGWTWGGGGGRRRR